MAENDIILPRWQSQTIQTAMAERRVLLLVGPRQCGKTTLLGDLNVKGAELRTLDDPTLLTLAQSDPKSFVSHQSSLLMIDEIQRAPALLPVIKQVVDQNRRPGQFLLTGSANIQSLPTVQESLAGRVTKIRLRPLSQGEIKKNTPKFLKKAFAGDFNYSWEVYNRDQIMEIAFRGGFPETIHMEPRARRKWHKDYIDALLERDLKDIAKIRRKEAMADLVKVMASWSSKYMDISAIGAKLSLQRQTLETYINALETLYLVERVPPWTKTDYQRVGKHAKGFMSDSGLMTSLLGWNADQVRLDSDRIGKLFETFVFAELSTLIDIGGEDYQLYQYRDRTKHEIDFLIERSDGALLGVEVKASTVVQENDFKHLRWFKDNLIGDRPFVGIVLYAGEFSGSMGNNMFAVPYGALW
ncbi:ATP-binding protein [Magnetovibrio sp. PR-2]|uniref:ATP-binding protein n=1 Tax=Magnetovibrio sp. PR-2 TaxID=3120356 RepID=UPI002FCE076D